MKRAVCTLQDKRRSWHKVGAAGAPSVHNRLDKLDLQARAQPASGSITLSSHGILSIFKPVHAQNVLKYKLSSSNGDQHLTWGTELGSCVQSTNQNLLQKDFRHVRTDATHDSSYQLSLQLNKRGTNREPTRRHSGCNLQSQKLNKHIPLRGIPPPPHRATCQVAKCARVAS